MFLIGNAKQGIMEKKGKQTEESLPFNDKF
jgi:hypothetical protein